MKLGRAHKLNIITSLDKPLQLAGFQQLLRRYFDDPQRVQSEKPYIPDGEIKPLELLYAIQNGQMELLYQPQFDTNTGKMRGCEALIRWRHPHRGLILPEEFINLVEQHGWMELLTRWVIEEAVKQEQIWKSLSHTIPISVNISASNITSLSLPEQVGELLESKQLDSAMLTLEITETALMGELVTSLDILTRLRLKGIGLSIDDFGTGYSSLSQLHKVPFSELKIDQSFVSAMIEDEQARAIVKTCIMLGHELKMKVVAEGVESEAQLKLLRHMGCDISQGFFCSKPVSADKLTELLDAEQRTAA